MSEDWLHVCQNAIQYRFHDPQLLKTSLTHSSRKSHPTDSNERLEFLGDAILGFVVSEYLFKHNPRQTEGDLTKIKSVVVSRRTLAEVSRRLQLFEYIRVGKGVAEKKAMPHSLLANVLEAVIGAIYLDGGMEAARRFVLAHIAPEIAKVKLGQHEMNFKSLLQQFAQRELGGTPLYTVIKEEGPDHVKQFHVVAMVNGKAYSTASGRSKKEAEQKAAELTLRKLMEANGTPEAEEEAAAAPHETDRKQAAAPETERLEKTAAPPVKVEIVPPEPRLPS